jgi:hypothetical protein
MEEIKRRDNVGPPSVLVGLSGDHWSAQRQQWASESSGGCSGNCASVREFGGATRTVMKCGFRLAQESASRFVSKNRSITIAFRS